MWNVAVPKSQPIAYAQLAFYLHRLGDTDAVTATIEVSFVFHAFWLVYEHHVETSLVNCYYY